MKLKELELIPNQKDVSEPLFQTDREYQEFRDSYSRDMAPKLMNNAYKRAMSEQDSRMHIVY